MQDVRPSLCPSLADRVYQCFVADIMLDIITTALWLTILPAAGGATAEAWASAITYGLIYGGPTSPTSKAVATATAAAIAKYGCPAIKPLLASMRPPGALSIQAVLHELHPMSGRWQSSWVPEPKWLSCCCYAVKSALALSVTNGTRNAASCLAHLLQTCSD